jgi:diaminopimelate decarboxylase
MFLTPREVVELRDRFGTPCYVYDRAALEDSASRALAFPHAFGLTVRYALKANSTRAILSLFRERGLHADASSDPEVERALRAGFAPDRIMLTSQAPSRRLEEFVRQGVRYNACSLHQLECFAKTFPGLDATIRVNPGLGSGAANRVNTGGPASSFGIWHEDLGEAQAVAARHGSAVRGLHTHIGSGSEPEVWTQVARLVLEIVDRLPDVRVVNLGGGFNVARMPGERGADLQEIGGAVRDAFVKFERRTGRPLHLEIEPGAYLVANAGAIVASCIDVADTGSAGFRFAKLDAGMTELLRPSLYGAQHPIEVVPVEDPAPAGDRPRAEVVFVGPNCETGDVLTPAPADPEALLPRDAAVPRIGDLVVIGGAGAYSASMATVNYNSYPSAPEVLREAEGRFRLVRRRQTLDQIVANEVDAE